MASVPVRIEQDLFTAAKAAGALNSRSAAQQIDNWARIGRELEAAPAVTLRAAEQVRRGEASYDDLGDDKAQAMVRAGWDAQLTRRIAAIDRQPELEAAGTWVEADEDGNVVVRASRLDA